MPRQMWRLSILYERFRVTVKSAVTPVCLSEKIVFLHLHDVNLKIFPLNKFLQTVFDLLCNRKNSLPHSDKISTLSLKKG